MQSVPDFIKKLNGGYILDIRTYGEYISGHVCGALLIPTEPPPLNNKQLRDLKSNLTATMWDYRIDSRNKIYLYSKESFRAHTAAKILADMGFKNVELLGGVDTEPLKSVIASGSSTFCSGFPKVRI